MNPTKKEINHDSSALIIFIRNPELGKVKTRLAKDVGPEKALEIYVQLLNHTREVSLLMDVSRHLFYHKEIKNDNWSLDSFQKHLQINGGLGEKMSHAFKTCLTEFQKVLIIGSDCPQLNKSVLQEAIDQLDLKDVVIGPTFDGGYYLLGMKKLHHRLFKDMEWSVSTVYSESIKRLKALNLSYHILPKLSDIDYVEDWNKYGFDTK